MRCSPGWMDTHAQLSASNVQQLSGGLRHNTALRYLTLRKVAVGDKGFTHLAPALAQTHVQVLTLHEIGISDFSGPAVANILKAHNSRRDQVDGASVTVAWEPV